MAAKSHPHLSFTSITEDKKRQSTAYGSQGLVTPVNSTEVTPPGGTQFAGPSAQGQLFDGGMFDASTPSAMQVDSERGSDWEWWTMVM